MKKLLLPLLYILLFTACKKQTITDNTPKEIAGATANKTSLKISVCHHGKTISINLNAWARPRLMEMYVWTDRMAMAMYPTILVTMVHKVTAMTMQPLTPERLKYLAIVLTKTAMGKLMKPVFLQLPSAINLDVKKS